MREHGPEGRPGARAAEKLGGLWQWFLFRGVIAGLLGLVLLIWPSWSIGVLTVVLGLFLLIDGIVGLVGAWQARQLDASLAPVVVSLVVGAVLLFWPGATLRFLLVFVGLWALVSGIGYFLASRSADMAAAGGGDFRTIGIVTAVVGVVLVFWPGSGIVTVAWALAIAAFVLAAVLIFLGLRLKRLAGRLAAR